MANQIEIKVPDIGGAEAVDVIEVFVKAGDTVSKDDPLIALESDKATMDVPSPQAGNIQNVSVKEGDKVSEGSVILTLTPEGEETEPKSQASSATSAPAEKKTQAPNKAQSANTQTEAIKVPDMGGAEGVEIIEIFVKPGETVKVDDPLLTLESDKATMDVPSPKAGVIAELQVNLGDNVSEGDVILTLKCSDEGQQVHAVEQEASSKTQVSEQVKASSPKEKDSSAGVERDKEDFAFGTEVHAGPAVRRIAREFGVNLTKIKGTGNKSRITKEDVQQFVKSQLKVAESGGGSGLGLKIAPAPKIDFSRFGEVEVEPLSKIKKITGQNMSRNWITIPHVTQFAEADITELEAFRQQEKKTLEKEGIKLTPLVFIMKAVVAALKAHPQFNASLSETGEELILKKYFHIGVAVDTPKGLVVPVVRDVDKKGLKDLAKELAEISKKAREKGLSVAEMQGGCFTISSLGGIGGTAFTPIINAPEVAILGVSRSETKPVFVEGEFEPRLMLPLSLSYDHRVIDGADGARFIMHLANNLSDIRTLLL